VPWFDEILGRLYFEFVLPQIILLRLTEASERGVGLGCGSSGVTAA
jgi:hypothetical protein